MNLKDRFHQKQIELNSVKLFNKRLINQMFKRFYLKSLIVTIFQQVRRSKISQKILSLMTRNLLKILVLQIQAIINHITIKTNHLKFHMITNIPIKIVLKELMIHHPIRLIAISVLEIMLNTLQPIREIPNSYSDKLSVVYLKLCLITIKRIKLCIKELSQLTPL